MDDSTLNASTISSKALLDGLIRLHEASTVKKACQAAFDIITAHMPCGGVFAVLRPLEFELPALASKPQFNSFMQRYIETDHRYDIWLKRSPVHPRVTVVRHSDYTPHAVLVRSKFYRVVLQRIGCEHGTSIAIWRANTWLATFTIVRTAAQGDFAAQDLAFLRLLHPHLALAIKRHAHQQEQNLIHRTLDFFADRSQQGVIVLNWNLDPLYFNRAARELTQLWAGNRHRKTTGSITLGPELREAIERLIPTIEASKPNRPLAPRSLHLRSLIHRHEDRRWLARISFIPSKTLTYSKGSFLITLSSVPVTEAKTALHLEKLSRRELECVRLASAGLTNTAIAKKLGISPFTVRNQLSSAFHKLGVKSRHEITPSVLRMVDGE
jgi:DNA-binding CsgD family transcriptional regulator